MYLKLLTYKYVVLLTCKWPPHFNTILTFLYVYIPALRPLKNTLKTFCYTIRARIDKCNYLYLRWHKLKLHSWCINLLKLIRLIVHNVTKETQAKFLFKIQSLQITSWLYKRLIIFLHSLLISYLQC